MAKQKTIDLINVFKMATDFQIYFRKRLEILKIYVSNCVKR